MKKVLVVLLGLVCGVCFGQATIWSNYGVTTSARETSATIVQPPDATRAVGLYVSLNKGTLTNVVVTPLAPLGDGTYYPASGSAQTITGDAYLSFASGLWETGLPAKFTVTGTGDASTTAAVLTVKGKLR